MTAFTDSPSVVREADRVLFRNYKRAPVAFSHGSGVRLFDLEGREYLDFIGGIAVSSLGHAHPALVAALANQAARYLHVSNLYQIPEQVAAARRLVAASGLDRAFFCNSGAEANEAAIKLARKRAKTAKGPGCHEILVTDNSFHGRTLATVAATGNPRYQQGFEPLPPGFRFVPFDDLAAMRAAVTDATCAILVEPVQGEGGVVPPSPGYLPGLRSLCDEKGLLLILDEVQTGIGRTGRMFAYQHAGIRPDLVTIAKGVAGGVPAGILLATEEAASHFVPGDHGSTFGGNALASAAIVAVLDVIEREGLVENAAAMGARLVAGLGKLRGKHPVIREIRGAGLLVGVDLSVDAAPVVEACLARGLLVNAVRPATLRFAPPLVVTAAEVDRALDLLDSALAAVEAPGDVPAAAGAKETP
ncbi:MAG TPA: acetylornithine transaminase [Thermoanaerobaculia bacterium]|nr:acetylornithine transaminase [Thermoanaerobaculia bacterium]